MNNVTRGDFDLSPDQKRFKSMLEGYPSIEGYWNFHARDVDLDRIENDIDAMSRGEQIMLQFFVGVWLHRNELKLDFTDIAAYLDKENLEAITGWLRDPFWP